MPFTAGETVGQYRITEELGQGGMATVYKAYHASLDRFVAIKVLHPAFKDDESFYVRFQREAQIVARLEHPYIVPVYDFATDQPEPYIVMKFIKGQTLKARLKENPLSLQETLTILPAIATALTYAHQKGILHRDIKPSNVMLDNDGTPYLADFGLARIASSGESTMSQDVLIGTPNYISPEQAKGEKGLTAATDIYSLGIMLYEIVVGRVPYTADTPYAVVHDHIYKPLPIPSQVNPTVPPEVEAVLLKTLAKNPDDRYQSAVEVAEAFKAAVTKADLQELSAASVRVERFAELSATVTPTASKEELDTYIKQAVEAELKARSGSTPPTPPAAPPFEARQPRGRARHRSHDNPRARRSFWLVSGLAVLVFVCIAGLAVTINALQNPVVRSRPTLEAGATALPTSSPQAKDFLKENITVAQAQQLVEQQPDSAAAHLNLALAYQADGQQEEAEKSALYAFNDLNASGELLKQATAISANQGHPRGAIILGLAAYARDPSNSELRNQLGLYIYGEISKLTAEDFIIIQRFANQNANTGFSKAMLAQSIVGKTRNASEARLNQARILLDQAIELGDALPEAHLVYGNYYAAQDEVSSALESWRFAASFADAPPWVTREAEASLQAGNSTN